MKKKIFGSIICASIITIGGINYDYQHSSKILFSSLRLANVEALAETENMGGVCTTYSEVQEDYLDCYGESKLDRITTTETCDGVGSGTCCNGVTYFHYNCQGELIGTEGNSQEIICRELA